MIDEGYKAAGRRDADDGSFQFGIDSGLALADLLLVDPCVLDALKPTEDLPSMPAVALEVMRVAQDEEAGAEELASAVSLDPVLAAKILKVANSSLFSGKAEVTTLRRACARPPVRLSPTCRTTSRRRCCSTGAKRRPSMNGSR